MAGFLDKQERIVDFILTDEGKRLLSIGKLDFTYFVLFDDEVDYDPYVANSASFSGDDLESFVKQQTEASLVKEAVTGLGYKRDLDDHDTVNVNRPLFTMPQGQRVLSRILVDPEIVSGTIEVVQRKVEEVITKTDRNGKILSKIGPRDVGHERVQASAVVVDLDVNDYFDESVQEGILVRVFRSGLDGLTEVHAKKDLRDDISYDLDLKVFPDGKYKGLERRRASESEYVKKGSSR